MSNVTASGLEAFNNLVGLKFQLYNSLFMSLPFQRMEKTGILLSLLLSQCEEGYQKGGGPVGIIDDFFSHHTGYTTDKEKTDLLFRFVQYVERQVVLFDALEDAAFSAVNDMQGAGTLKQLANDWLKTPPNEWTLRQLEDFCIRVVLTAHPTQFYPGSVLGIIHDLSGAIATGDVSAIHAYLQQLGKTAFLKRRKPTPYDEAVSLIWYLERVFYPAAHGVTAYLQKNLSPLGCKTPAVQLGFWPGGDRDGNPFVTAEITLEVAKALRSAIIRCYYRDMQQLRRRLTFAGVEEPLRALEQQLYDCIYVPDAAVALGKEDILRTLREIRERIIAQHGGLFVHLIEELITKVEIFGLYFASMDIRQESSVHASVLKAMLDGDPDQRFFVLDPAMYRSDSIEAASPDLLQETVASMTAVRTIRQMNGPEGCGRYIISQCNSADNVLEVAELFLQSGWEAARLDIDIVPLFETIDDLERAAGIMETLYSHPFYGPHLQRRHNRQTIMLGFSDGTKDGGYLMANWSIYKAKQALTALSERYGIIVIFFDGRGGPTARGGGKTHKFYASMGKQISGREIQLTVQGQTISSNYGTVAAAQFNMEQLLHAGVAHFTRQEKEQSLTPEESEWMEALARASYRAYSALKGHPRFMDYLTQVSPLRLYNDTNIGSRPAKRGGGSRLHFKDLRAIPYVGAWAQLKQNVTGYYGVGTALQTFREEGKWEDIAAMYHRSLFFRTLLDNCEMAMLKCFFPLTAFLNEDPAFGEIWQMIHREYVLTKSLLAKLSGQEALMAGYPVERQSVLTRERIVLPLITIQQYAISRIREENGAGGAAFDRDLFEKLAMRCSFGIINAARNSA